MKQYEITVDGQIYQVSLRELTEGEAEKREKNQAQPVSSRGQKLPAPMAGTILSINVKVGDAVKAGDILIILEAMKMENEIVSPVAGHISAIHVEANQAVDSGQLLISL